MKRSHWIIAFVIVVGGFAGFQQFQSWSLNKPHEGSQAKSEEGSERAERGSQPAGGQGQGRGAGRSRVGETVPVRSQPRSRKASRYKSGRLVTSKLIQPFR